MRIEEIGRIGGVGGFILYPGVEHGKVWRFYGLNRMACHAPYIVNGGEGGI